MRKGLARVSFTMPPEWEPHERTWMAWPTSRVVSDDLSADELADMRAAWARVANAVVAFEPVTMVVDPADAASIGSLLDDRVTVVQNPLDDCWMRDIGPTYVRAADGSLAVIDWIFNGWGAHEGAVWERDSQVATFVAGQTGTPVVSSPMVNEGGGIHVDGRGTVLVTDTVQLDPGRNPDWTKSQVEAELARTLGVTKVVWVPKGLTRDYEELGTRGHIDIVACFADPDTILYHDQRNPEHPDFEVTRLTREALEAAGDWRLVPVPAPETLTDDEGWVDYSYINHYIVNGAVILCAFNDPADERAKEILAAAYPGREIVLVDARWIFRRGGGIHCITQQQPAVR